MVLYTVLRRAEGVEIQRIALLIRAARDKIA